MEVRDVVDADFTAVLALNRDSVTLLSPLDATGLDRVRATAAHLRVVEVEGTVAAFAIAFAPGATYDSVNYAWHAGRFDDFLYLDRIAVSQRYRRRGIATALYDDLETAATTHGRMVCEVNSDPPNLESLAFHHGRGYCELGHLMHTDGKQTVMLEKPL